MKSSMKNVTDFVTQAPNNLKDELQKATDKVSDSLLKLSDILPGMDMKKDTCMDMESHHSNHSHHDQVDCNVCIIS